VRTTSTRIKQVRIGHNWMLDLFLRNAFTIRLRDALPEDVSVVSAFHDPYTRSHVYILSSETWPEVADGDPIPDALTPAAWEFVRTARTEVPAEVWSVVTFWPDADKWEGGVYSSREKAEECVQKNRARLEDIGQIRTSIQCWTIDESYATKETSTAIFPTQAKP